MIQILKSCQKEIADFPLPIREDLADALARLEEGHVLSMPLSRPMPIIGKGVHELRLKERSGIYRVVYVLLSADNIYLLHGFQKKTEAIPFQNVELAKRRLKEVMK